MELNLARPSLAAQILHREPQPVYGSEARSLIAGKRVLVTGAGGSIGSEIVRQAHRLGAAEVFYLDNDEYALYNLQLSLTGAALLNDEHFLLADVKDHLRLGKIFDEIDPEIVFHAAAHKHLPLLERAPHAAILNNAQGTFNVVSAAIASGVDRLINISTDKAATPTSVLGMTKRLAEMLVARRATNGHTKLASVRFGNVLGSRGSFLETLEHQVRNGLPIQLTDLNVERYFMTIPEAAGLVIEAAVLADHGETYVLDMGDPIKITTIISRFCELVGLVMPAWTITGLREGEKLTEALFDGREESFPTAHPRINKAQVDEPEDGTWRHLFNAVHAPSINAERNAQVLKALLREAIKPKPAAFTVVNELIVTVEV